MRCIAFWCFRSTTSGTFPRPFAPNTNPLPNKRMPRVMPRIYVHPYSRPRLCVMPLGMFYRRGKRLAYVQSPLHGCQQELLYTHTWRCSTAGTCVPQKAGTTGDKVTSKLCPHTHTTQLPGLACLRLRILPRTLAAQLTHGGGVRRCGYVCGCAGTAWTWLSLDVPAFVVHKSSSNRAVPCMCVQQLVDQQPCDGE